MNLYYRLGAWCATVFFSALVIKQGPFLAKIGEVPVPLGAASVTLPLVVVLLLGSATLALPALLFRRGGWSLLGLVSSSAAWSLSTSSRLPWWLVGQKSSPRIHAPDAGVAVLVFLALLGYFGFELARELERYRLEAQGRGVDSAEARRDAQRLAVGHGLVVIISFAITAMAWGLFEGALLEAGWFEGVKGTPWMLVVLGSGILLLGGVLVVVGSGRRRLSGSAGTQGTWQPVDGGAPREP